MAEINPEHRRSWGRWRATAIEWLAVVISGLSVVIALFAHFEATESKIRAEMLDTRVQDLHTQINVYKIRANRLDAWLKAHGVPMEEVQ